MNKTFFAYLSCLACLFATTPEKVDIAVIGGGFAGLTCAYDLHHKFGKEVQIYEASDRLGGRAKTVLVGGVPVEAGGQFIADGGEAETLRRLMGDLGFIPDIIKHTHPPLILRSDGRVLPLINMAQEFYMELGKFNPKYYPPKEFSLAEALDALGIEPGEFRSVLEHSVDREDGEMPKELDARGNWRTLQRTLYLLTEDEWYFEPSVEFNTRASSSELIGKLASSMPAGVINLEYELVNLIETEEGVLLEFSNKKLVLAKKVVFAVPLPIMKTWAMKFRGILGDDLAGNLEFLGMGGCAKIMIPLLEPYADSFISINQTETFWLNGEKNVLTVYYGGGSSDWHSDSPDQRRALAASIIPDVEKLYPGISLNADPESWVYANWRRHPLYQGSYSYTRPGASAVLNEDMDYHGVPFLSVMKPVRDRFFVCGEYASLKHRATMEGAAESGARVAQAIHNLESREIGHAANLGVVEAAGVEGASLSGAGAPRS